MGAVADEAEQASVDSWINKLVGWCVALMALGIAVAWGGLILTVGVPVGAFPRWLGPSILVAGLALSLISSIGLLMAAAHLRRLIQR